MSKESVDFGAVTIGGKDGTDHEGEVHTSESDSLGAGFHGGHEQCGNETPEHPTRPVHAAAFSSARSSRCASCLVPFILSVRESAALMRPTWVKAWEQFPRDAPVGGSLFSAKSTTTIRYHR